MVIPDWTSAPKPPKIDFEHNQAEFTAFPMARPLDRLAAVIVDVFVLLLPVFVLLSAPFKRWLMVSFLTGSEPELFALIFAMTVLAFALITVYQTLMHYFFAATLGKILFDLRVQPVFAEEKLSLWDSFVRSILWTLETLCFGLPHLAVFSNGRRRPMHDRVCETIVVSRSDMGVGTPLRWERGVVRSFFGACLVFVAALAGVQAYQTYSRLQLESLQASSDGSGDAAGSCETITRNIGEDQSPHGRLEMAMSLYAAGLTDRACLEGEVEREIATQTPIAPVTYLAQAFINSDDAEVSNSYLDQVCIDAPNGAECAMSKVVTLWSERDWDGVNALFSKSPISGKGYLEVWAVRNYMKQAQYTKALSFIDSLSNQPVLAEFILTERVRALWNSYSESEAAAAYAQALPILPKDQSEELSSWLCAQQLQTENGCSALTRLACKNTNLDVEAAEVDYEKPSNAMSQILAFECRGEAAVDYLALGESAPSDDWKNFFLATLKRGRQNNQASAELYSRVIASETTPEILRVEAVRRLSEFASPVQLDKIVGLWGEFSSKESWVRAGNILLGGLARQNKNDSAMKVARGLMSGEALSPRALSFLAGIEPAAEDRKPASQGRED